MKRRKQHRKHWMHYKMKEQIRFKIGKDIPAKEALDEAQKTAQEALDAL